MNKFYNKLISSIRNFEKNVKGQKSTLKHYLAILELFDQEEHKEMEFFFYADKIDDAENLSCNLKELNYQIYGIERSKNNQYSIIGRTNKMSINEKHFNSWIEKMNEIAYLNNCIFDGWGTLSELK